MKKNKIREALEKLGGASHRVEVWINEKYYKKIEKLAREYDVMPEVVCRVLLEQALNKD